MNETTPTPPPVPDANPPDEQPTTVLGEQPAANPVAPDQPTQVLGTDPTQVGPRTRRYAGAHPPPGAYPQAGSYPPPGSLPASRRPTRPPGPTRRRAAYQQPAAYPAPGRRTRPPGRPLG